MKFISDITVNEIQQMGSDAMVVAAAKVSTTGRDAEELAKAENAEGNRGMLNYLMAQRHGTPFEHGALTVFVHAPIMVWREWMRHRIASYNEESGRYKQLDPVFWIPRPSRKLIPTPDPGDTCDRQMFDYKHSNEPVGVCKAKLIKTKAGLKECSLCGKTFKFNSPARPFFQECDGRLYNQFVENMKGAYQVAYESYERALEWGLAKEASRACLPVGIYSSCWVTWNPRSIMNFLSLRVHSEDAKYVSYPQAEIEEAAVKVEEIFKKHWPLTHSIFVRNGRVAP